MTERYCDPRWQKKRLKILERDEWTCQGCGKTDKTLHVHHFKYGDFKKPWDVPDEWLITLCYSCHEEEKEQRKESEKIVLDSLKENGFSWFELHSLSSLIDNEPKKLRNLMYEDK